MSFQIAAQEFHVLSDRYVVRTRVPQGEVTDDMVLIRARANNLGAGDTLVVQCFDHGYETLLAETEYRVTRRMEKLNRVESEDGSTVRQINETGIVIERVRDWSFTSFHEVPTPPEIVWNPGTKAHEVVAADGTVIRAFTKEDGGKEAAMAFAAS